MRNCKKVIMVIFLISVIIGNNLYAHQGKTDANGGHKDSKNVSGLGSYHYHCGGNPAHLHTNGVCPYSSNVSVPAKESTKTTSEPVQKQSTTNTTPVETKPKIIEATNIEIERSSVKSMKVGEDILLSASILPSDVTDKKILWKSSDESIATVDDTGKVIAKKSGTVEITANTSNNKTDMVKVTIEEEKEDIVENIDTSNVSKASTNDISNTSNEDNVATGIVGTIIVGLGGIFGYNKLKK